METIRSSSTAHESDNGKRQIWPTWEPAPPPETIFLRNTLRRVVSCRVKDNGAVDRPNQRVSGQRRGRDCLVQAQSGIAQTTLLLDAKGKGGRPASAVSRTTGLGHPVRGGDRICWIPTDSGQGRHGRGGSTGQLRTGGVRRGRQDVEDPVLSEIQVTRVYLACGSTDMRKSIDGLAVLV